MGLLADDLEDVVLPSLERRVLEEELEDITLGALGELLGLLLLGLDLGALPLEVLLGVDEALHVLLRSKARHLGRRLLGVRGDRLALTRERRVRIDEVLE